MFSKNPFKNKLLNYLNALVNLISLILIYLAYMGGGGIGLGRGMSTTKGTWELQASGLG